VGEKLLGVTSDVSWDVGRGVQILRVCLVPHFTKKNFGFWPIILQNGTKHHAKFLAKNIHSPFWILAIRGKKKKPKSQKALTHPIKKLVF
jgi:hypothetical protein